MSKYGDWQEGTWAICLQFLQNRKTEPVQTRNDSDIVVHKDVMNTADLREYVSKHCPGEGAHSVFYHSKHTKQQLNDKTNKETAAKCSLQKPIGKQTQRGCILNVLRWADFHWTVYNTQQSKPFSAPFLADYLISNWTVYSLRTWPPSRTKPLARGLERDQAMRRHI